MKEGSRSAFEQMEPNDDVLFFIRGTDLCKYHARVAFKAESGEFGRSLWAYDSPDWKLIYFVNDLTPVAVDKWVLLSAFGYDDPGDVLPGIRRVRDECVREIYEKYRSLGEFLETANEVSPSGPLRLQCAGLPSPPRSTGGTHKSRARVSVDEREALRIGIANAG